MAVHHLVAIRVGIAVFIVTIIDTVVSATIVGIFPSCTQCQVVAKGMTCTQAELPRCVVSELIRLAAWELIVAPVGKGGIQLVVVGGIEEHRRISRLQVVPCWRGDGETNAEW